MAMAAGRSPAGRRQMSCGPLWFFLRFMTAQQKQFRRSRKVAAPVR
jgi:hypothetical protein